MRSVAREVVYKYLFSKLFNEERALFVALVKEAKLDASDTDFAKKLLSEIEKNYDELMSDMSRLVKGYKVERVFNADKCALLIGFAELKYFSDTPKAVAIDEAVNLVGKYSTEKSLSFVNGVLGNYSKELTKDDQNN